MILCSTKATTNVEYKEVIKLRIKVFIGLMFLGSVTLALAIINELTYFLVKSDFMSGVCSGMGTGLLAASIIMIIKNKKLLKDEAALKRSRLRNQDERNILISQKAMKSAAIVVIIFSYIVMLVAGFYSKAIFFSFWGVVMLFVFAYISFTLYLNKKL